MKLPIERNTNSIFWRLGFTALILMLLGVGACPPIATSPNTQAPQGRNQGSAPTAPAKISQPEQTIIGILLTDGSNVFVNRRQARNGETIRHNDNVSTGTNSKAKVEFARGGYIELAPDTDPDFRILQEGFCLWMRILTGRVFIETNGNCTQVQAPDLVATLHSQVQLSVSKQRATLIVLRGEARVLRANRVVLTVRANEELAVSPGAQLKTRPILRPEIENATRWRIQKFSGSLPTSPQIIK